VYIGETGHLLCVCAECQQQQRRQVVTVITDNTVNAVWQPGQDGHRLEVIGRRVTRTSREDWWADVILLARYAGSAVWWCTQLSTDTDWLQVEERQLVDSLVSAVLLCGRVVSDWPTDHDDHWSMSVWGVQSTVVDSPPSNDQLTALPLWNINARRPCSAARTLILATDHNSRQTSSLTHICAQTEAVTCKKHCTKHWWFTAWWLQRCLDWSDYIILEYLWTLWNSLFVYSS